VNTHAIGDRANRLVLDAYEAAMEACDAPVRRPRLEHAQILHPDDLSRFGDLDVIASVQPLFATSDKAWVADRLGPDRLDGAYAWKSLQNAGAHLAFGSDAPVEPIDPLQGFHAAVTRQDAEGHPEDGWRSSERLSRATALQAYTLGGAVAAFQEHEVGSITPGKRADWVVLSQNIMTCDADTLLDTTVLATYVDGAPVYTAKAWPDP
jgi:predicted amidohydrolase YtcJ